MDRAVLLWVAAHRTGWATASARALMAVGTETVPAAAAGLVVLILVAAFRSWRLGATAALAAVVAGVLSVGGKLLVHRPRPPADLGLVPVHGASMPSTDAALTAAAATVLIVAALRTGRRLGRALTGLLLAGAGVVGAALVYLGAHWVSDVLAGWVLGAVTGFAVARSLLGLSPLVGRRRARAATRIGPIPQ